MVFNRFQIVTNIDQLAQRKTIKINKNDYNRSHGQNLKYIFSDIFN